MAQEASGRVAVFKHFIQYTGRLFIDPPHRQNHQTLDLWDSPDNIKLINLFQTFVVGQPTHRMDDHNKCYIMRAGRYISRPVTRRFQSNIGELHGKQMFPAYICYNLRNFIPFYPSRSKHLYIESAPSIYIASICPWNL